MTQAAHQIVMPLREEAPKPMSYDELQRLVEQARREVGINDILTLVSLAQNVQEQLTIAQNANGAYSSVGTGATG